jgi:ABC-type lipoprotein release transport system permease subunit
MTFTVNAFLAGIIVTLISEVVIFNIIAIICVIKHDKTRRNSLK